MSSSSSRSRRKKSKPKTQIFHCFPECFPHDNFYDNMQSYIKEWCVQTIGNSYYLILSHRKYKLRIPLFTIEAQSSTYCQHCKCAGWNYQLEKTFHFIVTNDEDWNKCKDEDWNKSLVEELNSSTHLLHGVIHSNGFGHLVRLNGIDGGSLYLSGTEIMDLWDRICCSFRTRKISLGDTSMKGSLNLHVICALGYGYNWFRKWGYIFYLGTYGVTKETYTHTIQSLQSIDLDKIATVLSGRSKLDVENIVLHYRSVSQMMLITVGDIMKFLLIIQTAAPGPPRNEASEDYRYLRSVLSDRNRKYPSSRIKSTAYVILEALKQRRLEGMSGMCREDLRAAAKCPRNLFDHTLSVMKNKVIIGNHVIYRLQNPETKKLEYFVDGLDSREITFRPGVDVFRDLTVLYEAILSYCDSTYPKDPLTGAGVVQNITDAKYFLKIWNLPQELEAETEIMDPSAVNRTMACTCGASRDDGEEMLRCDNCRKWLHTRCIGSTDPVFRCLTCGANRFMFGV